MITNEQRYKSSAEKKQYVMECETHFEDQMNRAIGKLLSIKGLEVVTLSGPTCSGKTTTAKKIINDIGQTGRTAHVVSIDDFYRSRNEVIMKPAADGTMKPDYESVDSIDLDALTRFTDALADGEELSAPIFDFESGERSGYRKIEHKPGDIVVFEGIQAIYPEVTQLLSDHVTRSIYISVAESLSVGGVVFAPDEIRLLRRIVRDYNYRAASPELTFYLWDGVRANEIEHIEPYCGGSDIAINSLLPYEIGVLKPYLLRILNELPKDSKFRGIAEEINDKLTGIVPISAGYIPDNSVYREFLH